MRILTLVGEQMAPLFPEFSHKNGFHENNGIRIRGQMARVQRIFASTDEPVAYLHFADVE
jgi:hypothetical protein